MFANAILKTSLVKYADVIKKNTRYTVTCIAGRLWGRRGAAVGAGLRRAGPRARSLARARPLRDLRVAGAPARVRRGTPTLAGGAFRSTHLSIRSASVCSLFQKAPTHICIDTY